MLETPLFGRFSNEDRVLTFTAPEAYHLLIRACVVGGILMILYGRFVADTPLYPEWWIGVGLLLALAGVVAAWSLVLIRFDLKRGAYRRREGRNPLNATTHGVVASLDAVVLIAEPNPLVGGVTYHLVLHWKANREAPMLLQSDTRSVVPGAPLNAAAGPLRDRGLKYAQALKVPFYDNAHFSSPCPVRLWR